jgi:hypothetical protein
MRSYDRTPSSELSTASDASSPYGRAAPYRVSRTLALVPALASKARQVIQAYQADRTARTMILAVMAANLSFIGVHIILRLALRFGLQIDASLRSDLMVGTEGGYPEMFNYLQLAVLIWLLLDIFVRTRQRIYAALGVVFLFALAEDTLEIHERMGNYARIIDIPAPAALGAHHFGELFYFAVIGSTFIAVLICGLLSSDAEDRKLGGLFAVFIGMLGFCAAVLDAVNIILSGTFPGARLIFDIAEDGGEMLAVGMALSAALLLSRHLENLRRPS